MTTEPTLASLDEVPQLGDVHLDKEAALTGSELARQEENPGETGRGRAEKLPKHERCLQLAQSRYEFRRTAKAPYLLHDGQEYLFHGASKKQLLADLRHAWREKWPDETPPRDPSLNSVVEDLKLIASRAELDPEPDPAEITADSGASDSGFEGDGLDLVTGRDDCPLPDGYQIPGGFQVTPNGIWSTDGRYGPSRVSWAWLFPVRVYIDPDGAQWIELAWFDHGHWVSRLIRKSVAKSGRKMVAEIGDIGLPVTDSEARDAERWLAAAEASNNDTVPRLPVARQLGWQKDGTFVTGQDAPWRVEPSYPDQAAALGAHHPKGTPAGWKKATGHAKNYKVVQAGIWTGLAPVLLEPLDIDSFTTDVGGKSTRGKTITAAAALSCWCEPSQGGDGMISWQATVIQIEKRLNLCNGMLAVIDESQLATDPAAIDTVLYVVPKNHGKPRGGGYPNMIPWRVILFSTGERPITSFTANQGVSARVLSIQRAPFGAEGEAGRKAAEALSAGIAENFGLAGPAFAARVQELISTPDGRAQLRKRHAELTEKLRGETDMSGRRAPLIAVIALAAELANKWKITEFDEWETAEWLALFSADEQRDNRSEMALDVVREYIAANKERMWGSDAKDYVPVGGWIGRYVGEDPALLHEKLSEELKRRGYQLEAVVPGWLEADVIVVSQNPALRPPWKIPQRIGTGRGTPTPKHVIFRSEAIDLGDAA